MPIPQPIRVSRIADSGRQRSSRGDGDKIGSIGQIYLDDNTGEPQWVTVKTGLFGTSESFVPLDGATLSGGDVVVKYDKATVKDAPRVDADGNITPGGGGHPLLLLRRRREVAAGYASDADCASAGGQHAADR